MEQEIYKYLSDKYPVSNADEINELLAEEISNWKTSIQRKLNIENPFFENQEKYATSIQSFNEKQYNISNLENDYIGYNSLSEISKCRIDKGFWEKEIVKFKTEFDSKEKANKQEKKHTSTSDLKLTRKLLLQNWDKSLNEEYSKWELSEIEKYRQEEIKKLENWIELLQQFQDLMQELSFDTGLLFDLSHGNISLNDINQLKKWAEYISKNEGVRQLCDMLGKLRNIEKSTKQELININTHIEETIKDYTSKEEIVGIKIGNELEHVLPQELALLGDEETSILFDKKFVESELMCFDIEGTSLQTIEQKEENLTEINEDDKMGPIIICIDTSGSMSGSPETIAKAIALYISSRAKKQERDCFLINFSTSIETLDLSGKLGIKQLIDFLGRSFYGGTDVAPAIKYAIKKMTEEAFKKADLLIISDFIMATLPHDIEQSITEIKKDNNKFYSLSIGDLFLEKRMKAIFDGEWVYNPQNTSITQIRNIVNEIDRTNNAP
jgi:uncharacterized protein with von Willebrand factor type A (vWA) domain